MTKILVTGGCGFLGSHLVDKLVNLNHTITVIDNLSNGKISNLNDSLKKSNLLKQIYLKMVSGKNILGK